MIHRKAWYRKELEWVRSMDGATVAHLRYAALLQHKLDHWVTWPVQALDELLYRLGWLVGAAQGLWWLLLFELHRPRKTWAQYRLGRVRTRRAVFDPDGEDCWGNL